MTCHQYPRRVQNVALSFLLVIISSKHVLTTDFSSIEDPDSYKISWKGPMPDRIFGVDNVIEISTKSKEQYKCVVPDDTDESNFDSSARNSSLEEKWSPIQVLQPLFETEFCNYKFEIFWIYELCHGKYLRQYHEMEADHRSKVTQEYFLGRFDSEDLEAHKREYEKQIAELERTGKKRPTVVMNGVHKPYVSFNMTGGTKCDLTKRNRITKLIYLCGTGPNTELHSVKEISICEYEAIVLTPLLCHHKDFKIETSKLHEISCYSINGAPRRPAKTLDDTIEDETNSSGTQQKYSLAYFQGRALIIDTDLLLS